MKIPKYIQTAIRRRAEYADHFLKQDAIISKWIDKNNIDCEYTHLHAETISNPYMAAAETIEIIEKSPEK